MHRKLDEPASEPEINLVGMTARFLCGEDEELLFSFVR
jgi:hypothetical protein